MPFQEESQFQKQKQHYELIRDKMKEMKKKIKAYVISLSNEHKSLDEFSNNFLYVREVNFSSFEGKEYFTQGSDLLLDLGKVNLKYYLEEGESLLDKASAFCSLLKGVCDVFVRWEEFLQLFEKVDKANHLAKSHPKKVNLQGLSKEHDKIIGIKTNFIKKFQKELSNFCSENKYMFSNLTDSFKNLINSLNSQEKTKLSHLRESLCLE